MLDTVLIPKLDSLTDGMNLDMCEPGGVEEHS